MHISLQQEVAKLNPRLLDNAFYHQVNHHLVMNSTALCFFVLYVSTFVILSKHDYYQGKKYDLFNHLALKVDYS